MSYIKASPTPDGRCKIAGTDDNGREVSVILNPLDAVDIGTRLDYLGRCFLAGGLHKDTRAPRDDMRGQDGIS